MTAHDNPLDEGWLEWLSGCYRTQLQAMLPAQRAQLEAAFYAGRVSQQHGHQVVIDAIYAHLERAKAATTGDEYPE